MKRKRLALLATCIVIMMIGSGCMSKMSKEKEIEDMIACMNAKYSDDTFTYVSTKGGQLGSESHTYVVCSERYPEKPIWVIYSPDDDICWDTYLGARFEKQTKELLTQLMIEAFGDNCYVDYYYSPDSVGFSNPDDDENLPFAEYMARPDFAIQARALVNGFPEDGEEALQRVKEVLSNVDISCGIHFINKPDIILNEDTVNQIFRNNEYAMLISLSKSGPDVYNWCEWEITNLYREELNELIQQRLAQIFGEDCYVEIERLGSLGFPSIPSFEEYIVHPKNGVRFSAIVRYNPENHSEIEKKMEEAFADVVVDVSICFITDPSIALDAETSYLLGTRKLHAPYLDMNKSDLVNGTFSWGEI